MTTRRNRVSYDALTTSLHNTTQHNELRARVLPPRFQFRARADRGDSMTEEEARKLSETIVATWPTSAKAYIWKRAIGALDAHVAEVTYRVLRDGAATVPTVGSYLAAYASQHRRLRETPLALDLDAPAIVSPAQYVERLQNRASHDPRAADELEHFAKVWRRRGLPIETANRLDVEP